MNAEKFFRSMSNIEDNFIEKAGPEADAKPGKQRGRFFRWRGMAAAAILLAAAIPITGLAVDACEYNAAVDYLASRGIEAQDLRDCSRKEVKAAARALDAWDMGALDELFPVNGSDGTTAQTVAGVTEAQVRSLTPDMTYREIVQRLGDTLDVGSGIYILKYRVDNAYMISIPLAGDDAQLGVAGEKLLEAKEPLEEEETDPLAEGGGAERELREVK